MRVTSFAGACAIALAVAAVGAMPAQAFNIPGIVQQATGTVGDTIRDGAFGTAMSLVQYRAAHSTIAADPQSRFIVVLGARINADGTLPEVLNCRLDAAAAIARAHPSTRVIATGGRTQSVPYSEAQAMLAGLVLRGVNPANIITENESKSTVGNARNAVEILRGARARGAVVVSSESHIGRAVGNFNSEAPDLDFVPVGVQGC